MLLEFIELSKFLCSLSPLFTVVIKQDRYDHEDEHARKQHIYDRNSSKDQNYLEVDHINRYNVETCFVQTEILRKVYHRPNAVSCMMHYVYPIIDVSEFYGITVFVLHI
jgi:hypothetical protein